MEFDVGFEQNVRTRTEVPLSSPCPRPALALPSPSPRPALAQPSPVAQADIRRVSFARLAAPLLALLRLSALLAANVVRLLLHFPSPPSTIIATHRLRATPPLRH
jgi:hypothetical protein